MTTGKESSEGPAKVCPSHGIVRQFETELIRGQSFSLGSGCQECDKEVAQETDRREKHRRDIKFSRDQQNAGIPIRYRGATIGPFPIPDPRQKEVIHAVKEFVLTSGAVSTGLILLGTVGTGKTHVACAILNGLLLQGSTALFLTTAQALRRIKESWGKGAEKTEQQALSSLVAPDVLVLDEIGVQRGSDFELVTLDEIVNERYNRRKPTILISNLTMKELAQLLGERVTDRFQEGGRVLVFDWPSLRRG